MTHDTNKCPKCGKQTVWEKWGLGKRAREYRLCKCGWAPEITLFSAVGIASELQVRIRELEAENARLRETLAKIAEYMAAVDDEKREEFSVGYQLMTSRYAVRTVKKWAQEVLK